jgi:hypothetical protein
MISKFLFTVVAATCVLACGGVKESDPNHSTPAKDDVFYLDTPGGSGDSFGCNTTRVTYVYVTVKDHSFWVEIPTACNSAPQIYKGDPGPDMGDPYNYNEVSREEIVQAFELKWNLIQKSGKSQNL